MNNILIFSSDIKSIDYIILQYLIQLKYYDVIFFIHIYSICNAQLKFVSSNAVAVELR